MGNIANMALLNYVNGVANSGQSGTMPMVAEYNAKRQLRTSAKKIGKDTGIYDDENDWLARQLKEEEEIARRMYREYGLRKAEKLK